MRRNDDTMKKQGEQVRRQWEILKLLEKSKYGLELQSIANPCGCSKRTVYRDLETLYLAGFPIKPDYFHRKRIWRYVGEKGKIPSLPISFTEFVALRLVSHLLEPLNETPIGRSLRSFFDKINKISDISIEEYFEELSDIISASMVVSNDTSINGSFVRHILTAIRKKRCVELHYIPLRSQRSKKYLIAPYQYNVSQSRFIYHCVLLQ